LTGFATPLEYFVGADFPHQMAPQAGLTLREVFSGTPTNLHVLNPNKNVRQFGGNHKLKQLSQNACAAFAILNSFYSIQSFASCSHKDQLIPVPICGFCADFLTFLLKILEHVANTYLTVCDKFTSKFSQKPTSKFSVKFSTVSH
jgi:hypothetical protein